MISLTVNRNVNFDFEIIERYHAGIALFGFEAKSLKLGRGTIAGASILLRGGEAILMNAEIPPYQTKNTPAGYDSTRPRKLLLTRRELDRLAGKTAQKNLTLVPIRFYTKGPRIKLEFALVSKKKRRDKRELMRKREIDRIIERAIKRGG